MHLHYGDLIDGNCLVKIVNTTKPTEIYNLGAQSHVKVKIDDFSLHRIIGRGGFGEVYGCRKVDTGT